MGRVSTDDMKEVSTDLAKEGSKDSNKDYSSDGKESSFLIEPPNQCVTLEQPQTSTLVKLEGAGYGIKGPGELFAL